MKCTIPFQTLADKIAVSCSLVRGEYNRAWNEVLLPDQDYTVSICLYSKAVIVHSRHK